MHKKPNHDESEDQDQGEVTFVFEPIADDILKNISGGCKTTTFCTSGSQQYEELHD